MSAPRQRSPWFYALLGCGALALLICLGGAAVVFGIFKMGSSVQDGIVNVTERRNNAIKQLGAIPPGYDVVLSVSVMGLVQNTVLTTREIFADGGASEPTPADRTFIYSRNSGDANGPTLKAFIKGDEKEARAMRQAIPGLDLSHVIERGTLELADRSIAFMTVRAENEFDGQSRRKGLVTLLVFECGGDALQLGMWSQTDPTPDVADGELDKAGTVFDQAEMSRFLSSIDPCHK